MSTERTTLDLYKQINTKDAAKLLGVTTRKLEQMRQHGTGPTFVRVSPKCVRYRLKELIAFQDAHLRKNTIQAQGGGMVERDLLEKESGGEP